MAVETTSKNPIERPERAVPRFDPVLLIFLLVGWSFIFMAATLGLARHPQRWLPVNLVAQVAADYSQDTIGVAPLARVNLDIVEAVRQDAQAGKISANPTLASGLQETLPTPTNPVPTITPTAPLAMLEVSAGGPYWGDEGSPISLTAGKFKSMLRFIPGAVSYHWDFNGDEIYNDARGVFPSVIYYDEGVYPIGVQAIDLFGRVATDTTTVTVRNLPPQVQIKPEKSVGEAQEVAFSATATDPGHDVLMYQWEFGDGSKETNGTLHPNHTFLDDGDYTVRLRVTDNDGGIGEASLKVEVDNLPPEVDAGPDQLVDEGLAVTLNGQATDPSNLDTLTYFWDFDFDGVAFTPDATGSTVSTTYANGPANFAVALLVRDKDGGETIDTLNVTVNDLPPTIGRVINDGPVGEGSPVTLAVEASDAAGDPLSYAFDWNNDGFFDLVNQTDTVAHIWYQQGSHTVGIQVDDGNGSPVFTTTTVTTFNEPPTAVANYQEVAFEGEPITFDGSDSTDPGINSDDPADPANDILSYRWDFGDGAVASGLAVTHAYPDNRVYSATLTVNDDSGATAATSFGLTILNANPQASAGPDRIVSEGSTVTYLGTASDPGQVDQLSYAWDFDYDGANFDEDALGPMVEWSYPDGSADSTQYVVALRVRDSDYPSPTDQGGQIGENLDTLVVAVENLPPVVEAGGPYQGTEGQIITLNGTADDVAADTLAYAWDFDFNGVTFTPDAVGQTVTHTWQTGGDFPVRLQVTDDDGGVSFADTLVDVNALPLAEAGGPYVGFEGADINFDGSSSSDPDQDLLTYHWNFGDGTPPATGMNVLHRYVDNGVYTATLTVTDSAGGVDTGLALATVLNANPVVEVGPDRVTPEGVQINLAGTAIDPGSADVLTYTWDFNYDGYGFDQDAVGPTADVVYLDGPAAITVALRVRDDDYPYPVDGGGQIGENMAFLRVNVSNTAPVAVAGGPYAGVQTQPVTLTGVAADVSADTLTYEWDVDYDGVTFTPDLTGPMVSNVWSLGGVYDVALRVTDDDGGADLDITSVDIDSVPIANAGGPYSGDEGLSLTFDGQGSYDPDGDPLLYTWDFGDGSLPVNGPTATHIYSNDGTYAAVLEVDDGRGGVAADSMTVTIGNLPPTAVALTSPNPAPEGSAITFDGVQSTDPGASDQLTYQWDFGDGSSIVTGPNVSHTYADNGSYTAILTVTDDGGAVDTAVIDITVENVPPVAASGGPYVTTLGVPITLAGTGTDIPADTLSYAWDLDDDGLFETAGQIITHTWLITGNHSVTLQVTDDDGDSSPATTTVNVGSPPSAEAGGPYTGDEGNPLTLLGSGLDPDGDPLVYAWDLDNDGSFETVGAEVTNTWVDNGSYPVVLQVEDDRGGLATDSVTVIIDNLPPTAETGPDKTGFVGELLTFDGSGSSDPGANDTLSYEWDFGDGTPTLSDVNPTHTYLDPGVYTATLTVTDNDGAAASDNIIVTIEQHS